MFNIDRLIDDYSNSFYDYKKSFLNSMKNKEFTFLFSYPSTKQIESLVERVYKEAVRGEWNRFIFLHEAQSAHINKQDLNIKYKILWMGLCIDEGSYKKNKSSFHESILLKENHSRKKFSNFVEYLQYLVFPILYGVIFPVAKVQISLEVDQEALLKMHTTDFIIPHHLAENQIFPNSPFTPNTNTNDYMRDFINLYHSKENDIYKGLNYPKTKRYEIKDRNIGNLLYSFMMSFSLIPIVIIVVSIYNLQKLIDKISKAREEKELLKLKKEADDERFLRIYDQ